MARIAVSPASIPEHDYFATDVLIDGTLSADPIDDPEGAYRLSYEWKITGDEFRFVDGDASTSAPTIELRGDRPATIALTVTDSSGLSARAELQLQLTLASP